MMVMGSTAETCTGGHSMLHVIRMGMNKVQCPFDYGDNYCLEVIGLCGFRF